MFCTKCGQEINLETKICPKCGNNIDVLILDKSPKNKKNIMATVSYLSGFISLVVLTFPSIYPAGEFRFRVPLFQLQILIPGIILSILGLLLGFISFRKSKTISARVGIALSTVSLFIDFIVIILSIPIWVK